MDDETLRPCPDTSKGLGSIGGFDGVSHREHNQVGCQVSERDVGGQGSWSFR